MLIVPLTATPSQTLNAALGNQQCAIAVYQKSTGLYLDLTLAGAKIIGTVICHDRCLLVRQPYLGFVGDLCFIDTQGRTDPVYTGLGTRYLLAYLEPSDLSVIA